MTMQPLRAGSRDLREPVLYELDPLRLPGHTVMVSLSVRYAADAVWRGRLQFVDAESGREYSTAEIFCGAAEEDLWQSLRGLREHHMRDLFRSLA